MFPETLSASQPRSAARAPQIQKDGRLLAPVLPSEQAWREDPPGKDDAGNVGRVLASRRTDARETARVERSTTPADRQLVAVCLRPARVRPCCGSEMAYEGTMPTGMVHVAAPGQTVRAEFGTPSDFIHYRVLTSVLDDRAAPARRGALPNGYIGCERHGLRDILVRDDLAAQLSRTLTESSGSGDPGYADSVGRTIRIRLMTPRPLPPRAPAVTKPCLRRVEERLASKIAGPARPADLARAAGMSRMHFAAPFWVATGCRPHEFPLQKRIEAAKRMLRGTEMSLAEIALSTGFQTQSHISTVFKRLAGDAPGRWQRSQREA